MDALTIHEAAETTGWSSRMLRYVEQLGLVEPRRSGSRYRLYGPEELQRLRTLREVLERHGIGLGERLAEGTRCEQARRLGKIGDVRGHRDAVASHAFAALAAGEL